MDNTSNCHLTLSSIPVKSEKKKLKVILIEDSNINTKSELDQERFYRTYKQMYKKELKLISSLIEKFLKTRCDYSNMKFNFKDPKEVIVNFLKGKKNGKMIIKKFIKENVDLNKFKIISIDDIIDKFIDIIYKHNIDPFSIKIITPSIKSYSDFWNKYSD